MTVDTSSELSARPLLRRQLDALADWLAKDHWTVEQAACLFVGVLPDGDLEKWLPAGQTRRGYGACLPGRESWPDADSWHWHILAEIEEMEGRLASSAKFGKIRKDVVLQLAIEAGYLPPWWHFAKADPTCAALLPIEDMSHLPESETVSADRQAHTPDWIIKARSKGGKKAAEGNFPGRKAQLRFVYRKIKEGRTNKETLDLLATSYLGAYQSGAERNWIPAIRRRTGIRRGSTSG
ncbi:hypothetical protein EOD23_00950 [Mesorhizobium sp. USDA-HM6]|nr:hypothetical protein EOD23_00950 [Mesorhizobium sp. USDA-HM6]